MMIVSIDKDLCTGCQECVKVCPAYAITGEPNKPQEINPDRCVICGQCVQVCKSYASIIDNGEEFVENKKLRIYDLIQYDFFRDIWFESRDNIYDGNNKNLVLPYNMSNVLSIFLNKYETSSKLVIKRAPLTSISLIFSSTGTPLT